MLLALVYVILIRNSQGAVLSEVNDVAWNDVAHNDEMDLRGQIPGILLNTTEIITTTTPEPDPYMPCPTDEDYKCGSDGVTYLNQCEFDNAFMWVKTLVKLADDTCHNVFKEEVRRKTCSGSRNASTNLNNSNHIRKNTPIEDKILDGLVKAKFNGEDVNDPIFVKLLRQAVQHAAVHELYVQKEESLKSNDIDKSPCAVNASFNHILLKVFSKCDLKLDVLCALNGVTYLNECEFEHAKNGWGNKIEPKLPPGVGVIGKGYCIDKIHIDIQEPI